VERGKLTSIGKRRAILLYILLARGDPSSLCATLFLTRGTRRRPCIACPIAAQSGVENHPVVLEELERIASAGRPERGGCIPTFRNGSRVGDIGRNIIPIKEPYGYPRIVPKHCQNQGTKLVSTATPKARLGSPPGEMHAKELTRVDTTAIVIESNSKRVGLTRPKTAPLVVCLQSSTVRAANKRP
jgi:hypothetical protein